MPSKVTTRAWSTGAVDGRQQERSGVADVVLDEVAGNRLGVQAREADRLNGAGHSLGLGRVRKLEEARLVESELGGTVHSLAFPTGHGRREVV